MSPPHSHRPALPPAGVLCGLLAAALFGASAPVAKRLLATSDALMLAGLLYLGAGLSLSLFRLIRPRQAQPREARLRRADLALLGLIVALGGIGGPLLMLSGLRRLDGLPAALLLNLEAPLTIGVAVTLFGEHLGRREGLSAALICAAAALLAYRPETLRIEWLGALALGGACLCWAVDNNLTQRLSLRDPVALVQGKTLGAGACSLLLALGLGQRLPDLGTVLGALALGAASYGVSVVLDTYALRLLGAAREAALFATAPFVGALLAVPLLGERPTVWQGAAAGLMVVGVALLIRARHAHVHTHEALTHEHRHLHDEHHLHPHPPGLEVEPGASHSHPHSHARLTHDHPHVPDAHHRHAHDPAG